MKRFILLALVTIFASVSAVHAEVSAEKRKEIEKMLQLTGTEKLMNQVKVQMISGLKVQIPDVPAAFWEKFQQKMDTHELLEKLIPLYDKYYTLEDLKAVNAFYGSPSGQKILSSLPQITQESLKIGQEWGLKWGKEAADEAAQESQKK